MNNLKIIIITSGLSFIAGYVVGFSHAKIYHMIQDYDYVHKLV